MSDRARNDAGSPDDRRRLGNLKEADLATNQEQSYPWFAGEEKLAVLWTGRVYNQFTREAPMERPGKK